MSTPMSTEKSPRPKIEREERAAGAAAAISSQRTSPFAVSIRASSRIAARREAPLALAAPRGPRRARGGSPGARPSAPSRSRGRRRRRRARRPRWRPVSVAVDADDDDRARRRTSASAARTSSRAASFSASATASSRSSTIASEPNVPDLLELAGVVARREEEATQRLLVPVDHYGPPPSELSSGAALPAARFERLRSGRRSQTVALGFRASRSLRSVNRSYICFAPVNPRVSRGDDPR